MAYDKNDPASIERNRQYQRDWYQKNKAVHAKRIKDRKLAIKKWFREYKATLSCDCGESHPACLDFHHHGEDKTTEICTMVASGLAITTIERELQKCVVLCSNCHRKLHYIDRT